MDDKLSLANLSPEDLIYRDEGGQRFHTESEKPLSPTLLFLFPVLTIQFSMSRYNGKQKEPSRAARLKSMSSRSRTRAKNTSV